MYTNTTLKSILLKCPSCGSNLEISGSMDTFAGGYCGASQVVERQGGTVSLRLVTDAIRSVQVGTDKTAAELALKRLAVELAGVEHEYNQTIEKQTRDLESNRKFFGSIWLVGLVVCFIIGAQGGGAAYFALFLGAVGSTGVIYLANKTASGTRLHFVPIEKKLLKRGNEIQKKIGQNKRLVDS